MSTQFFIFFSVFFSFYFSVNYYVFRRARQSLILYPKARKYFTFAFWLLPLSFILGRVLENWAINIFTATLIWVGSLWMGALTYFVLSCLVLDLARVCIKIFRIKPAFLPLTDFGKFKLGAAVLVLVFIITAYGAINALLPVVRTMDVKLPKPLAGGQKKISMLVASDIHLGTIVGKRRFKKLVETVNNLKPDVVVFAGDIVDEDIGPVIKEDMGSALRQINPPMGFFGITGNHEYIGGVEASVKYLEQNGVRMLRDQAAPVGKTFFLVGREDLSIQRMAGGQRKTLPELFENVPQNAPVIMLDHQPFGLKAVSEFGKVYLQISGHTHNGQLWPFNYIVKMIYEIAYGYGKIGNTQFYVSNGYGTWGPPLRVGNRPEIVIMNLNFE